jgi:hypothetical protein
MEEQENIGTDEQGTDEVKTVDRFICSIILPSIWHYIWFRIYLNQPYEKINCSHFRFVILQFSGCPIE